MRNPKVVYMFWAPKGRIKTGVLVGLSCDKGVGVPQIE